MVTADDNTMDWDSHSLYFNELGLPYTIPPWDKYFPWDQYKQYSWQDVSNMDTQELLNNFTVRFTEVFKGTPQRDPPLVYRCNLIAACREESVGVYGAEQMKQHLHQHIAKLDDHRRISASSKQYIENLVFYAVGNKFPSIAPEINSAAVEDKGTRKSVDIETDIEYPPNTTVHEVPTQNGLENVRIISCRSLAGVNMDNAEKPPSISESVNGESIGLGETILEQMNPELAVQKDPVYCSGAVTSCSVSSSTVESVSDTLETSTLTTASEYSPVEHCASAMVTTAVFQNETKKTPTVIPVNVNAERRDQENLTTKNNLSSPEARPVLMNISTLDESNSTLSSIAKTTLSDDTRATDVVVSNSFSTEGSLKSITDMCNKLPDIPRGQQTGITIPRFQRQRNTKVSTLIRTQEMFQRQRYGHPQSQKIPERLSFKIENPLPPQMNDVAHVELGEVRQRNTKTSTLVKVQKVFERQAYKNLPQSQPPIYQPEDFASYQAQYNNGVDKGSVYHYGVKENVYTQPPEMSGRNTRPNFIVEQSRTQRLRGAEIESRTLTAGVYPNNQMHLEKQMFPCNQLYPSNEGYYSNQGYPGNQAYSSREMYPSKAYPDSNVNCSNQYYEDYNNAYVQPPNDHNQPQNYSSNLYSPFHAANPERRVYPVTNASESYPGYASYGDGYLYCYCEQCWQAAMNQPVAVHMADSRERGYSSSSVTSPNSYPLDRGDEWISAEYHCHDTWLSDIYTEMSSLILGASPTLGVQANAGAGKYTELLAVIEELGKDIRPTYAGSKNASERLKKGIMHARALVRECLIETERCSRQ